MSARKVSVTTSKRASGEIAEVFTPAVAGWLRLDLLGVVDEVRQRLRLERKDGCSGQELFGLLFLMSMAGLTSQRALQRNAAHCRKALADVLGARTFRSQASMSRALQSVTQEQSDQLCDWLLGDALEVGELERDPSTFHLDTFGERWRMVDFDGRVHAIRQRALVESPEHPEPRRRSSELAKPGYSGRKRGEGQYHRMVVQDAGTGRNLGVRLGPGNGDHRGDVQWAVERVALWADALDVARSQVCARFDGKTSGGPALLDCRQAGLRFLTRWNGYKVLERPEVEAALEQGTWQVVPDSGSGPRREAMELGTQRFGLHDDAVQADDQRPYLEARMVVSRYRADQHKGSGKQKDDSVYELYITNLPAAAWPAGELVELYYGRAVEENRFEQADGEQGRQRVVSWHLPGQQLAIAVSFFAWNLRLTWGADLASWTSSPEPRLHPRRPELVEPASPSPQQPCSDSTPEAESLEVSSEPQVVASKSRSAQHRGSDAKGSKKPQPSRPYIAKGLIPTAFVAALEWPRLLRRHPGWRWDADEQELRCPAGETMSWRATRQDSSRSFSLIFRIRRRAACQACSMRASCTSSTSPGFRKELWISVNSPLLGKQPCGGASFRQEFALACTDTGQPGPWSTRAPTLVPSVLRKQPAVTLAGCRISATSPPAPITTNTPRWSAPDDDQRLHRRKTFGTRDVRSLMPPNHRLDICIHVPIDRSVMELRDVIATNAVTRNHRRTG